MVEINGCQSRGSWPLPWKETLLVDGQKFRTRAISNSFFCFGNVPCCDSGRKNPTATLGVVTHLLEKRLMCSSVFNVCVCVCVCVCGWVGAFTSTSLVADDFAAILSPLHCHRSRRSSSNGPSPAATVSSVGGGASLDWPVPSTAQRKAASKSSSDRVGGAKHKTPSNAESISNSPIRFQFISASFPNHFRIHFPVSFQFALYLFSKGAVSLRPKKTTRRILNNKNQREREIERERERERENVEKNRPQTAIFTTDRGALRRGKTNAPEDVKWIVIGWRPSIMGREAIFYTSIQFLSNQGPIAIPPPPKKSVLKSCFQLWEKNSNQIKVLTCR